MSSSPTNPLLNNGIISRDDLLTIISVGFRHKEYRFIRQAVLNWLAAYPGDLEFNYLYAKSLFEDGKAVQAQPILDMVCTTDPEYSAAHELRLSLLASLGKNTNTEAGYLYALTERQAPGSTLPAWSKAYRQSQDAFDAEKLDDAELAIQQALIADSTIELPAIFHLQIASALHDSQTLANLAHLYHTRWVDCLPITLYLAAAMLNNDEDTEAVALLHQCSAKDASGQVVHRIWGENHPYRFLWPDDLSLKFDLAIPGTISSALGWNRLMAGAPISAPATSTETPAPAATTPEQPVAQESDSDLTTDQDVEIVDSEIEAQAAAAQAAQTAESAEEQDFIADGLDADISYPTADSTVVLDKEELEGSATPVNKAKVESLQDIREELERIAGRLRVSGVTRSDARYPNYVIVTTRKGLETQYGAQTSMILDELMKQVVEVIRKKQGWNATLFYADDAACTTPLGIKPAIYNDPWKIKLAIRDLDNALKKKGEMIGALLIVGGPEIVPFHHLPNPTDDSDTQIDSDNPYATLDDNYFIPEWPVGRLPGGTNKDAGILMQYLRKMITYHSEQSAQQPWWRRVNVFSPLFSNMQRVFTHGVVSFRPSFGYTAAVWSQASIEVFRTIGDGQSMMTCPPTKTGELIGSGYLPARLNYYNLHGVPDGPEWYGQTETNKVIDSPEYPVAMTPKDIPNDGNAPTIVFSEACYGSYINNKNEDQAISLKFISAGTRAMVGSTCIAYGSVSAPLIGADLLGNYFWKSVKEGTPVGEALRNAKVVIAQEMTKQQGFLDGEDQKTLISFVLYGDPLVVLASNKKLDKLVKRDRVKTPVVTVCQNELDRAKAVKIDTQVMAQVKQIVEQYLPGLKGAHYTVSKQYATQISQSFSKARVSQPLESERTVVVVSKEYKVTNHMHHHYARMTFDNKGKVIKLAVSR
jgi:hypothetical protein